MSFLFTAICLVLNRLKLSFVAGSSVPIRQICDVTTNETCILLGTTFKQMQLQPSILKELSDELNVPTQPMTDTYTADDDVLYLEDMLQRIVLIGDINTDQFVTGSSNHDAVLYFCICVCIAFTPAGNRVRLILLWVHNCFSWLEVQQFTL